jgi:hypothetical protein
MFLWILISVHRELPMPRVRGGNRGSGGAAWIAELTKELKTKFGWIPPESRPRPRNISANSVQGGNKVYSALRIELKKPTKNNGYADSSFRFRRN